MGLYVSKPQQVEAVQWNGRDLTYELVDLVGDKARVTGHGLELLSGPDGAQGWVPVPDGDWIVRGGEPPHYWPVNAEHFAAKYEPVEEP